MCTEILSIKFVEDDAVMEELRCVGRDESKDLVSIERQFCNRIDVTLACMK